MLLRLFSAAPSGARLLSDAYVRLQEQGELATD